MKCAFLINDIVVEVSDISEDEYQSRAYKYSAVIDIGDISPSPKVGWIRVGNKLRPDIKPVTPRQIRQALILAGISIEMIETGLNSLPEPQKSLAKTELEYSTAFERNRPLVKSMGQMMGFSEQQLDDIWLLAMSLP